MKKPYAPPTLEPQPKFVVLTGVSLPIGTLSDLPDVETFLEVEP